MRVWQKAENGTAEFEESIRFEKEVSGLFFELLKGQWPIIEHISFSFLLQGIPIAMREQMVRHRVGNKVGDNFGVDVIPERGDSSFWVQSMRVLNMTEFHEDSHFHTPDSITKRGQVASDIYDRAMEDIAAAYQGLVNMGVPLEDARCVLPLGCNQSLVWTMNLMTLKHVIGKRTCWVPQSGFWAPVITGMVRELVDKVDGLFAGLLNPPCINMADEFTGCIFKDEMADRIRGKLPLPPCSLYVHKHTDEALKIGREPGAAWRTRDEAKDWDEPQIQADAVANRQFQDQVKVYREFWKRNPYTGERE